MNTLEKSAITVCICSFATAIQNQNNPWTAPKFILPSLYLDFLDNVIVPCRLPRGNHLLRIFSPCFFHSKPSVCIPSCQRGQMKLLNLEERNCEIQLAENMDHSLNSVHSSTLSFSCQYCRFPAFQLVINVGICWCMKSNTCTEEKWSFCCRCFCCCCNFCPPIRLIHRSIVDIPTNLSMLEMEGQPPCLGGKLTTSISGCRPWNGSSFFPSKCVLKVHLLLLLHVSHVISIAKRRFLTLFSRLYQVDNCPATLFTGGFGGPMTHDLVPFPCWLSL